MSSEEQLDNDRRKRKDFPFTLLEMLKHAPDAEEQCANIEGSRVPSGVVSSIPEHGSAIVQAACTVEAIGKEDYASWPSTWIISCLRTRLMGELALNCSDTELTGRQRVRYLEIGEFPHLLQCITRGFTRKLPLHSKCEVCKKGFIDELMTAGRRQSSLLDEEFGRIIDEANVVYIALSYKHAIESQTLPEGAAHQNGEFQQTSEPHQAGERQLQRGGIIDYETAEDAYEVISRLPECSHVRVWIDQNLHRYETVGPSHERGFLPYACMIVVSALGKHGGFGVTYRRPWVWVETGTALTSLGIHCKRDRCSTVEEVILYPQSSRIEQASFETSRTIIGTNMSVFDSVPHILRSISWWTPDMLSHQGYEYAIEFKEFVVGESSSSSLNKKGRHLLSTDRF